MKTRTFAIAFALVHCAAPVTVWAQGTAFTYEGRLTEDGLPARGDYDLRFAVYDSTNDPGTVVAGPLTNFVVAVTNGLFTVTLDFGEGVFTGAARWLEIAVRPAGGGDFTTLTPRQPITPTPYAMFASLAGTVPNRAITAAKLAAGAAAANLQAGGQSAVAGGGVILSEQANGTELINAGYQVIGRVSLVDEQWLARASGPTGLPAPLARQGHSAVWTGTELIIWGGMDASGTLLNTGARYHPTAGTWTRISNSNAPTARAHHRAVWTGTEMIVWGGLTGAPFLVGNVVTNTGARYHPATDTWTAIAAGGGSRQNHSAFWTGTEMLVWGGTALGSGIFGGTVTVPLTSGARYNLAADSWTFISGTGAPVPRQDYSAVFTGSDLIIWGGRDSIGGFIPTLTNYNDGARYNLAANTWTPVTLSGAPFRRYGHSAVWTGSEMIVWGGAYAEGSLGIVSSNYNNGARYNPAANAWSPMTPAAAPAARFGHDAVWAGDRMVVWGGTDGTNLFDSGARYSPAANSWSAMTDSGRPAGRSGHATVWSASEMIVWGGFNGFLRDLGGRYNPLTDVWQPTPPTGERSARRGHSAIWTGNEVILWGGYDGERYLNTGGRYFPASNLWVSIPTNGAPAARAAHRAVWTGTEMIVWGGIGPDFLHTGGRFNPATGLWAPMSANGAPTPRNGHVAVWIGNRMVVWGGLDGEFVNTGGRYNPANDSWTATAVVGAPAPRTDAAAVWAGTELLVWGGTGGTVSDPIALATGGRYNPSANTWAPLPPANAPAARTGHRAVWTGHSMLVWGGTDLTAELNTGGRYDRGADAWSAISTNNAPIPRTGHTAVWDGTRVIVWGGVAGDSFLRDGGIYDPQTDLWLGTLTGTNAPPARDQHVAVWTGSEMMVHGGYGLENAGSEPAFFDDTWHYIPPRTMFLYLKP